MGQVYMIQVADEVYYGSTKQKYLSKRQARHNWNLRNKKNQLLYKKCIDVGIERIKCIKLYEGDDYLQVENQYIIDNECINERHVFQSIESRKETARKYRQSEKGKIAQARAMKRYRERQAENLNLN